MPGVFGSTGSYGVFDLNQGVYTVMSYNDAWDFHPDGPSPFTIAGIDNGWSGRSARSTSRSLQQRYGVHADYNEGNNVYALTDVVDDAYLPDDLGHRRHRYHRLWWALECARST